MYCLFCVVLCIVCVYMCTVLLPPGGNPIAVNKYINIYLDIIVTKVSLHIELSYSYATMYNLMMTTTKAETCSC